MEQRYDWAVRVTIEYFEGGTQTWKPMVEVRPADNGEAEARARHAALTDYLASARPTAKRAQRITDVQLVKRPVGDWEVVA